MTTNELHELASTNQVVVNVTMNDGRVITGRLLFVADHADLDQVGIRNETGFHYPAFSDTVSIEVAV